MGLCVVPPPPLLLIASHRALTPPHTTQNRYSARQCHLPPASAWLGFVSSLPAFPSAFLLLCSELLPFSPPSRQTVHTHTSLTLCSLLLRWARRFPPPWSCATVWFVVSCRVVFVGVPSASVRFLLVLLLSPSMRGAVATVWPSAPATAVGRSTGTGDRLWEAGLVGGRARLVWCAPFCLAFVSLPLSPSAFGLLQSIAGSKSFP
jgi:hypothetical protein